MWMMSVPMATWTVTGTFSRWPAASRLLSLYGKSPAWIILPTHAPMPSSADADAIAWFSMLPVSSAMPKAPERISLSTSSDVWPMKASSKSWMIPAPFRERLVMMPRSIRSMITGFRPTLIEWAPMPSMTGRWSLRAWTTAATTSFKCCARKNVRER